MKKLLVAMIGLVVTASAFAAPEVKIGEKAPEFALTTMEGKMVKLSDYAGKVVVLGFVDTCMPCQIQAQELEKVRQRYAANAAVVVLGIVFEDQQGTKKLLKAMNPKANYPLLLDPSMSMAKSYGLWGDPQVAIIGKNGKIIFKNYMTMALDLIKEVNKLLP